MKSDRNDLGQINSGVVWTIAGVLLIVALIIFIVGALK